jgi:hypothetical protein
MSHHASLRHHILIRLHFRDARLPLTLGFLIIAYGLWDCLQGALTLGNATRDPEQTIGTMTFLCGIYLLLSGLWLATRSTLTPKRALGMAIMLVGILAGTWIAIRLTAPVPEDPTPAYLAFFAGLLLHLLGVLYVRKD